MCLIPRPKPRPTKSRSRSKTDIITVKPPDPCGRGGAPDTLKGEGKGKRAGNGRKWERRHMGGDTGGEEYRKGKWKEEGSHRNCPPM